MKFACDFFDSISSDPEDAAVLRGTGAENHRSTARDGLPGNALQYLGRDATNGRAENQQQREAVETARAMPALERALGGVEQQ